jgi:hypothetical protein
MVNNGTTEGIKTMDRVAQFKAHRDSADAKERRAKATTAHVMRIMAVEAMTPEQRAEMRKNAAR